MAETTSVPSDADMVMMYVPGPLPSDGVQVKFPDAKPRPPFRVKVAPMARQLSHARLIVREGSPVAETLKASEEPSLTV